ncbi:MAG: VOC family protein [Alphaproteobacteria bacterium]
MTPHGHFHWNELMTGDVEAAKTFYADSIGWTFQAMPMEPDGGTYWLAMDGETPVAGLFDKSGMPFAGTPEAGTPYLSVDNIDKRAAAAVSAGATILQGPFDVPGVGRIALLKQPGGAMVGWMTPAEQAG